MATGKCRSCGHTAEFTQDDIDDLGNCTCGECGGSDFEVKGVNDDEDDEDEDDEEEEYNECEWCESTKDLIYFEAGEVYICKKCIDKSYPREKEIVEKVVEKIVEKPVIAENLLENADTRLFKPETKTQFD
jgi:hypothetical protein